jgi:hypothetical protein
MKPTANCRRVGCGLAVALALTPGNSASAQKQTFGDVRVMSTLPPKADITAFSLNVRYGPKADTFGTR